jgi:hypothetical protein
MSATPNRHLISARDVEEYPPDITKLPPHLTPYNAIQQPMSRGQAKDIIALSPDGPATDDALDWTNYASALYISGSDDLALWAAERAVSLDRNSTTLLNLGVVLEGFGRFREALNLFAEARQGDPYSLLAGSAYADALVRLGLWGAGWPMYAIYHSRMTIDAVPSLADVSGKRVLVIHAGGAGDSIYHLRWLARLAASGCRITYAGPASLLSLFENNPWIERLIPVPRNLPGIEWYVSGPPSHASDSAYRLNLNEFDFFLSIMTLAAVVSPSLDRSLWPGMYIHAPRASLMDRARSWTRYPCVGLCWRAGEHNFPRLHRTLSRSQLVRLVGACPRINWVSLVPDEPAPQRVAPSRLRNWRDTACLVSSLDAVVSVDTGVAHLAGAMGKPVHVPLPGASAWPYGLNDDYRLAYPSMRAYRNDGPGIDQSLDSLIEMIEAIQ